MSSDSSSDESNYYDEDEENVETPQTTASQIQTTSISEQGSDGVDKKTQYLMIASSVTDTR